MPVSPCTGRGICYERDLIDRCGVVSLLEEGDEVDVERLQLLEAGTRHLRHVRPRMRKPNPAVVVHNNDVDGAGSDANGLAGLAVLREPGARQRRREAASAAAAIAASMVFDERFCEKDRQRIVVSGCCALCCVISSRLPL